MDSSLFLPPPWLNWDACLNARDLGGYPTRDGGRTRCKALVRSECLCRLTPAGRRALIEYGVRTVIDLRFADEIVDDPNPFAAAGGQDGSPLYLNYPLDEDQHFLWPDPQGSAHALFDLYRRLLETNRLHVARVLAAVASAQPGGVLFHCAVGKDRTGLIAALILGLAGVAEEHIIADYALQNERLLERTARFLANPPPVDKAPGYWQATTPAPPEAMNLTLDYLRQQYGGVEGYLRSTPLSPGDATALRARVVEPA